MNLSASIKTRDIVMRPLKRLRLIKNKGYNSMSNSILFLL